MGTKVIVLGGGIIGMLTAYFLNKKGFSVTVIEKRSGVALGTSLANGSQVSFSHTLPSFFEPKKNLLQKIFEKETIEKKINKKNPDVKNFLLKQKEEILKEKKNIEIINKITEISKGSLEELIQDEQLERYFKSCGIIHFFEDSDKFEEFCEKAKLLNQKFKIYKKKELYNIEPNLENFTNKIISGVYFENDKTTNCHDICKILEGILKERGVDFIFNTNITSFKTAGEQILAACSADGKELQADAFICANGTEIEPLVQTLGLSFNIFPVRGYSYTFNVEKVNYAPFIGLIDKTNRIVYSLYKSYLRVAGFFDLGVNTPNEIAERLKQFEETIITTFPLLKRNGIVHKWTDNRPFTPSCVPIVGKTQQFSNLFINGGHGSSGVTLSFGSGRIISELI